MDIDRLQRTDIDKVADDRITLAIDPFNTVSSPYTHEDFDDYKCNNWVVNDNEFIKYNLAENDYLTLVYNPITNLSEKDIKKIIVSFDYELKNYDSFPILDNISLIHDSIDYKGINLELDNGHVDMDCSLFGIDNEVLNSIVSKRGFAIGLNFDGNKSNANMRISNIKLNFSFINRLQDEIDAVVNRMPGLSFLNGYRNYSIFSSNYNPQMGEAIVLTCIVTDLNNNPVPDEDVQLYLNNESLGSQYAGITNNEGKCTFNYTIENDGLQSFSVNNAICQVNCMDALKYYPVGAIYISVNSVSPEAIFGGTWERIKDTFLLASGDTYSNGSTGGSADAVVVSHTHKQDAHTHKQDAHSHKPSDSHKFVTSDKNVFTTLKRQYTSQTTGSGLYYMQTEEGATLNENASTANTTATNQSATATNQWTGESGVGKNMPPYISVYMWVRIS